MPDEQLAFGFPDFWSKAYQAYQPGLDALITDMRLACDMFNTAHHKITEPLEKVVYMLVSLTANGLHELLILAGNGAGMGAMKISRGMFESAVMAEYLRRNPHEIHDYLGYGHVLNWKRLRQFPESATSDRARQLEDSYNQVKPRFTNKDRNVRQQWNKNSISKMASAVGREQQYELAYSLAASIHHGNVEAMLAHIEADKNRLSIAELPSLEWIKQALISGHVYLLQALSTLNDCLRLGFHGHMKAANEKFQDAWRIT